MADRYRVEIAPSARRQVLQLQTSARERVRRAIRGLAAAPRPQGARQLSGERGIWRIRVGDYRVLYRIGDRELLVLVLVVRVGHRRDVYRGRRGGG